MATQRNFSFFFSVPFDHRKKKEKKKWWGYILFFFFMYAPGQSCKRKIYVEPVNAVHHWATLAVQFIIQFFSFPFFLTACKNWFFHPEGDQVMVGVQWSFREGFYTCQRSSKRSTRPQSNSTQQWTRAHRLLCQSAAAQHWLNRNKMCSYLFFLPPLFFRYFGPEI